MSPGTAVGAPPRCVAWDTSGGASSYQIVLDGTIWGTTTSTTVTLAGLNPSTQHCVGVTADGPGGARSAAPICGYTGFYVPVTFHGGVLGAIAWLGQTPRMPARVEGIELAPQAWPAAASRW